MDQGATTHRWIRGIRTRLGRRLPAVAVLGMVSAGLAMVAVTAPASAAADPCAPGGSKIACENSKPGSPSSEWEIDGPGDDSIQGFSTEISVNAGQKVDFKIDTDATNYSITLYRMGWYGGDGARKVATVSPSATLPQHQPACITDVTTELYDCGNWKVSASWNVPSDAVSGVYIALLHRPDRDDSSHITFVVRNDASHSDVVFQTSDTTWQAYNIYGGSDFYHGAANGRAYKVSYNRPVLTRNTPGGQDFFFANEYPLVRFLERNGYDVSYLSGVDTDRSGSLLLNHKVFLSVGHDEYWSGKQRANVEAARDSGVNLQFLGGNDVYWRTRYEPSIDGNNSPYRTLVSYKEAWSRAKVDPTKQSTSTWRDPRFAPQSQGGGKPENALTGTIFMSNYTDLPLTVTRAEGKLRLWRNTGLSSMTATQTALAPHTVGYETNEDQDNGFRPPGVIRMSTTTGPITGQYMYDYGAEVGDATTTHSTTLYRAPSGALVFSAGSVQWTWGLDEDHDSPYADEPADVRMQQAQVNLLADMGAQPATRMTSLVAATKSTDTTAPTVSIQSPANGASFSNGTRVSVSGTATDQGGTVAGVEYSTDGGETWHPATGTTSWSFTYTQNGLGSAPLRVRAVDDSANIGTAQTRTFNVACPCTVFGNTPLPTTILATAGPAYAAADDTSAVELGMRFTPEVDGQVKGVRFYKGTGNTGTHVGSLWSNEGQRLATVTFSNESASGWQSATFSSPVAVSRGETYIVSYTAPAGHYASQHYGFSMRPTDAFPLTVDGGFGAQDAGVYSNPGTFPMSSYRNSNYYVDAIFDATDGSPLIAVSQWPMVNSSSVDPATTISARFSKPVVKTSVTAKVVDANSATVPGTTTYDAATRKVTFTPSANLAGFVAYTVTLSATGTDGSVLSTGKTWKFTTARPPAQPGVCPCTLFDDSLTPQVLDATDGSPVTLGVRFTSTQTGVITGVRFYKAVTNRGSHTGTLWSADGDVLATGTFTDESSFGWQFLTFDHPVSIKPGREYIASYFSSSGHWSVTPNAFLDHDLSRGPLKVTSTSGSYGYPDAFPASRSASNYLVDPVFEPRPPAIAIDTQSPAPGAVDVPRASKVVVTFTNEVAPGYDLTVSANGGQLSGSVALGQGAQRLKFSPAQPLPKGADVTVSLRNVTSVDGAVLGNRTWAFRTANSDDVTGPESVFDDELPEVKAANEGSSVELGMKFIPQKDGVVSALRYYRDKGNDGVHTGSLWSATGQRLATVTFANETATGWQTAQLSTPVNVTAGQTYVVSYLAPQGHYSFTYDAFTADRTVEDIKVPGGSNGVYLYAGSGGFPTYSHRSTNYFVDVVYRPLSQPRPPQPVSLFADQVPELPSVSDGSPLNLGMGFTPDTNGYVTKVRFYKGDGNNATHTGSVWSSSGQLLGTVTFSGESASGWQEATLSQPVRVLAGQTYVVSYFSPTGVFAISRGFFGTPITVGPLTAVAGNGRYGYSSSGAFPGSISGNGASYLVDVVFQADG